jgi:hypothetical protein
MDKFDPSVANLLSASEARSAIESGLLSSQELVAACFARIDELAAWSWDRCMGCQSGSRTLLIPPTTLPSAAQCCIKGANQRGMRPWCRC